MNKRGWLPVALVLGLLVAALPPAAAQSDMNARCEKDWHGKDNEFGRICMKYQDSMLGEPIPVEARIVLHRLYGDRDATYFLFMIVADGTPFKLTNVRLATADGKELNTMQREATGTSVKILVDTQDMPPAETELVLSGRLDSCDRGLYQVGALVQPFNYRWQRVVMGNGEPADLFSFTQVGVNEKSCSGSLPGLPKLEAPSGGLVGAVAAFALVGLALRRRRA